MKHGIKCERCGTVDDTGPHTPDNCIGVLMFQLSAERQEIGKLRPIIQRALEKQDIDSVRICALDDIIASKDKTIADLRGQLDVCIETLSDPVCSKCLDK